MFSYKKTFFTVTVLILILSLLLPLAAFGEESSSPFAWAISNPEKYTVDSLDEADYYISPNSTSFPVQYSAEGVAFILVPSLLAFEYNFRPPVLRFEIALIAPTMSPLTISRLFFTVKNTSYSFSPTPTEESRGYLAIFPLGNDGLEMLGAITRRGTASFSALTIDGQTYTISLDDKIIELFTAFYQGYLALNPDDEDLAFFDLSDPIYVSNVPPQQENSYTLLPGTYKVGASFPAGTYQGSASGEIYVSVHRNNHPASTLKLNQNLGLGAWEFLPDTTITVSEGALVLTPFIADDAFNFSTGPKVFSGLYTVGDIFPPGEYSISPINQGEVMLFNNTAFILHQGAFSKLNGERIHRIVLSSGDFISLNGAFSIAPFNSSLFKIDYANEPNPKYRLPYVLSLGDYAVGDYLPQGTYVFIQSNDLQGKVTTKAGRSFSLPIFQTSPNAPLALSDQSTITITQGLLQLTPSDGVATADEGGISLKAGHYQIGSHFPSGEYTIIPKESAFFTLYEIDHNNKGHVNKELYLAPLTDEVSHILLEEGSYALFGGDVTLLPFNSRHLLNPSGQITLSLGSYQVGDFFPPGEYAITATSPVSLHFVDDYDTTLTLNPGDSEALTRYVLEDGQRFFISKGTVTLTPFSTSTLEKSLAQGILPAGLYQSGQHFPSGSYTLTPTTNFLNYTVLSEDNTPVSSGTLYPLGFETFSLTLEEGNLLSLQGRIALTPLEGQLKYSSFFKNSGSNQPLQEEPLTLLVGSDLPPGHYELTFLQSSALGVTDPYGRSLLAPQRSNYSTHIPSSATLTFSHGQKLYLSTPVTFTPIP